MKKCPIRAHLREDELIKEGVQASGKLQLLDMMLQQLKAAGRKVVILFHSEVTLRLKLPISLIIFLGTRKWVECVPINISYLQEVMFILSDYMRRRYGEDKFVIVDKFLGYQKNQDAMAKFSKVDSGHFAFLLSTAMCGPTVSVTNVDTAVIFEADLNPNEVIHALQKALIRGKSKELTVYRLYCRLTIEEAMLVAVREKQVPEQLVKPLGAKLCQQILRWGVKELLSRNDEISLGRNTKDETSYPRAWKKGTGYDVRMVCLMLGNSNMQHVLGSSKQAVEGQDDLVKWILTNRAIGSYVAQQGTVCDQNHEDPFKEDQVSDKEFWSVLLNSRYNEWQDTSIEPRVKKKIDYREEGSSPEGDFIRGEGTSANMHLNVNEQEARPVREPMGNCPQSLHVEVRVPQEFTPGCVRVLSAGAIYGNSCLERPCAVMLVFCVPSQIHGYGTESPNRQDGYVWNVHAFASPTPNSCSIVWRSIP